MSSKGKWDMREKSFSQGFLLGYCPLPLRVRLLNLNWILCWRFHRSALTVVEFCRESSQVDYWFLSFPNSIRKSHQGVDTFLQTTVMALMNNHYLFQGYFLDYCRLMDFTNLRDEKFCVHLDAKNIKFHLLTGKYHYPHDAAIF